MSQEIRADRLQVPLGSAGQGTNGLEVLLGAPAPGYKGEGSVNGLHSNHFSRFPSVLCFEGRLKVGCEGCAAQIERSQSNFFSADASRLWVGQS